MYAFCHNASHYPELADIQECDSVFCMPGNYSNASNLIGGNRPPPYRYSHHHVCLRLFADAHNFLLVKLLCTFCDSMTDIQEILYFSYVFCM
mmetsp:Transcript_23574/g.30818  ORF Transcript_23574/g.30818 Transcript_23574/m.30818 type:complete len:92 (-) Transcript_23574:100-375(-)